MPRYVLTFDVTLHRPEGKREFRPCHIELECADDELDVLIKKQAGAIHADHAKTKRYARIMVQCVLAVQLDGDGELAQHQRPVGSSNNPGRAFNHGGRLQMPGTSAPLIRRVENAFEAIGQPFLALAWKIRWLDVLEGKNDREGEVHALESVLCDQGLKLLGNECARPDRSLGWVLLKIFVDDLGHHEAKPQMQTMSAQLSQTERSAAMRLYDDFGR